MPGEPHNLAARREYDVGCEPLDDHGDLGRLGAEYRDATRGPALT